MAEGMSAQSGLQASSPSPAGEWYAGGLRFSCTQCGNCCTGPPGYVWFTPDEGRAMALELGLTEAEFLQRYTRREGSRRSLNERPTEYGQDCVFLDRTTFPGKAVCSIYRSRPMQCRTWPFWPENLRTRATWDRVKRHTPCPGMDTGRLVPIESIRVQRDASR